MQLLLACAGATYAPAQLSAGSLDWGRLEHLARRHGVTVLLCRYLSQCAANSVPAEVLDRLLDLQTQNAWRAWRLTEELCAVLAELAQNGIAAIPYKGPLLGQTLYGDMALRHFNDLDILIRQRDVAQATLLLERRGYRNKYRLASWQERHILKNDCEYDLAHTEKGIYLDLHWNFAPRYFTLRFDLEGLWQRARPATLNGYAINSLTPEDTLLVLAVNAAKDYWSKLLPVCDIAEMVKQTPEMDWPQLWQRATDAGAQRMLAISLRLAQDLLATPIPLWVQEKLAQDTALPSLTAHVKTVLCGDGLAPFSLASYLSPACALPNRRARLKFYLIFGLQPSFEDWGVARLPARLSFLYYLTRPLRLAQKYLNWF